MRRRSESNELPLLVTQAAALGVLVDPVDMVVHAAIPVMCLYNSQVREGVRVRACSCARVCVYVCLYLCLYANLHPHPSVCKSCTPISALTTPPSSTSTPSPPNQAVEAVLARSCDAFSQPTADAQKVMMMAMNVACLCD